MPTLKPNEAICHECGEVIDLNRLEFRFRKSDGKFYHYECLGNRITLVEMLEWTFAAQFASIFGILDEIAKGVDDNVSNDQEER